MKICIAILSILAISSTGFSKTLTCTDQDEISVTVDVSASGTVNSFTIDAFQPDLGKLAQADMVSYDGNAMSSQVYEKTSTLEGQTVTEKAKFGIQKIGSTQVAYLKYSPSTGADELETLLICK